MAAMLQVWFQENNKMEFRTTKREKSSLGALITIKCTLVLSLFWIYQVSQHVSLGFFLFCINLCSAVVYLFLQKPLSKNNRLTMHQWLRVLQMSFFSLLSTLLWLAGLRLCGPLRTILLWEHSEMALVGVINTLLACGSHSKSRGAVLFVLGFITLLLFDNDQAATPIEHPEGDHTGLLLHVVYWMLSYLGVPDHKWGVVLLFAGTFLSLPLKSSQRLLAVDIGGAKKLQSLVVMFQCFLLLPWTVYGVSSISIPWFSFLLCLFVVSCVLIVDFYVSIYTGQHLDSSQMALHSSLVQFLCALVVAVGNYLLSPEDLAEGTHGLSVGVLLAFILLFLATVFLTRSPKQSQGILIGYSAAGLPLYSSNQFTPQLNAVNWFKPVIGHILDNLDSRRIFYFLILNLGFTGVEMMYGLWTNSLGLISDAFHMLFDCGALVVGLFASVMSHWKPTRLHSFGFARVEMLSGFVNALFLIVIALFILMEALSRLVDPPDIVTDRLLFVSVAGFFVNLIGIFTFHSYGSSHGHHDHIHENSNMRGVFLHILADTMGSVGVIVSSLLVKQFGLLIADPICSLFISTLIVVSVIPLLKSSASGLMLATPDHTRVDEVIKKVTLLDGVLSQSDAHFWHQGHQIIGTLHVQVAPSASEQKIAHMINQYLRENKLMLLTLQVEKQGFINSGLRVSYVQQQLTPQIYVDYGPHTGEIKSV